MTLTKSKKTKRTKRIKVDFPKPQKIKRPKYSIYKILEDVKNYMKKTYRNDILEYSNVLSQINEDGFLISIGNKEYRQRDISFKGMKENIFQKIVRNFSKIRILLSQGKYRVKNGKVISLDKELKPIVCPFIELPNLLTEKAILNKSDNEYYIGNIREFITLRAFDGERKKGEFLLKKGFYALYMFDFDKINEIPYEELIERITKVIFLMRELGVMFLFSRISRSGNGIHILFPVYINSDNDDAYAVDRENRQLLKRIANEFGADVSVYDDARVVFNSPYPKMFVYVRKRKDIKKALPNLYELNERLRNFVKEYSISEYNEHSVNNSNDKKDKRKRGRPPKTDKVQPITQKEITNPENPAEHYWSIRLCLFENTTIQQFINDYMNADIFGHKNYISNYAFRQKYGYGRQQLETGAKILARHLKEEGIVDDERRVYYDRALDTNVKERWICISLSPNENSPYDIFLYIDNNLIFFQSPNSLRHLGELAFFVEGVKYVGTDEEGKPMFELIENCTKPYLKPEFAPLLLGILYKNWGVQVPEGFEYAVAYRMGVKDLSIYVARGVALGLIDAIDSAINKNLKEIKLAKFIPLHLRRGEKNKQFKSIINYINDKYSDFIEIKLKGKGRKQAYYLIIKDSFKEQLSKINNMLLLSEEIKKSFIEKCNVSVDIMKIDAGIIDLYRFLFGLTFPYHFDLDNPERTLNRLRDENKTFRQVTDFYKEFIDDLKQFIKESYKKAKDYLYEVEGEEKTRGLDTFLIGVIRRWKTKDAYYRCLGFYPEALIVNKRLREKYDYDVVKTFEGLTRIDFNPIKEVLKEDEYNYDF